MTPPAAAGWDAEAAAQALLAEWDTLLHGSPISPLIARHLTLARAAAPSAEAMRRCIEQFADHKNWYDAVGCLQWMGKRHAIDYAESVLSALPPAQPPAVGDDDESTRDTLLLLNEAISLGRRYGMCGQHLDAMCSARDEIERLSVLTATTLPAVRRAVQDGEPE